MEKGCIALVKRWIVKWVVVVLKYKKSLRDMKKFERHFQILIYAAESWRIITSRSVFRLASVIMEWLCDNIATS